MNMLYTTLTQKEIEEQFTVKFDFVISIFEYQLKILYEESHLDKDELLIVQKYISHDYYLKDMHNLALNNIINYLIKYKIRLTEFDILKILNEVQNYLIQQVSLEFDILEERNFLQNMINGITVDLYITFLFQESNLLDSKDIIILKNIITNNKFESIFKNRGIYYIMRNIADLLYSLELNDDIIDSATLKYFNDSDNNNINPKIEDTLKYLDSKDIKASSYNFDDLNDIYRFHNESLEKISDKTSVEYKGLLFNIIRLYDNYLHINNKRLHPNNLQKLIAIIDKEEFDSFFTNDSLYLLFSMADKVKKSES